MPAEPQPAQRTAAHSGEAPARALPIPALQRGRRRQILQAIVDPIGYYRLGFTLGPSRPVRLRLR